MTIQEFVLCLVGFIALNTVTNRYFKNRFPPKFWGAISQFPGFILATIISDIVSQPGDKLLGRIAPTITDQYRSVGFPISFYEVGGFSETTVYWPILFANCSIVVLLGILLQRRLGYRRENDEF